MTRALCTWVGVFRWPGKAEFLFGPATIEARPGAPLHEIEAALDAEFAAAWARIMPDELPRPALVNYRPGTLVFIPEETT